MKAVIIISFILGIISVALATIKSGRIFKSIVTTAFQGIAAILSVNAIGIFSGVTIALNWYTIGCAAFFGLPAVISTLLLDIIFR